MTIQEFKGLQVGDQVRCVGEYWYPSWRDEVAVVVAIDKTLSIVCLKKDTSATTCNVHSLDAHTIELVPKYDPTPLPLPG